jgi:hypothetical protein
MSLFRPIAALAATACVCSAWSFTINESYYYGHNTTDSDCGGTIVLGTIEKTTATDPIIASLASNFATYMGPNYDFQSSGTEVSGEWAIDRFDAQLYPMNDMFKYYGSTFCSRIVSTENLDSVRFVWLTSDMYTDEYPRADVWFAEDRVWLFSPDVEPLLHNGSNEAGSFTYREDVNMGIGRPLDDNQTYRQDHWLFLVDEQAGDDGKVTVTYRGGIHYFETVYTNPVPEPASMFALAGGAGVLLLRRRKR